MKGFQRLLVGLVTTVAVGAALTAPANAGPPVRGGQPATYTTTVEVETYTTTGELVSSETYTTAPQAVGTTMSMSSRTMGRTGKGTHHVTLYDTGGCLFCLSQSGCRTLTVTNNTRTIAGWLAFRFVTSNYWCWNLSQQRIYNVDIRAFPQDVDSQFRWDGVVGAWSQPSGAGGRVYYRQGQFRNCILNKGCVATYYPSNQATLGSAGQWSWETHG